MNASKRMRVLWLCSWYPSEVEPFSGDFIQRHAYAVSDYVDVQVLHAVGDPVRSDFRNVRRSPNTSLVEWINYYPARYRWQKWMGPLFWVVAMWRMFSQYRSVYGLPDLIHVQVPYKSGLIARYILWLYGIPYVLTEHWGIYHEGSDDRYANRSFLFRALTRFACSKASLSLSVSAYQARKLDEYVVPLPAVVVNNAVDTDLFRGLGETGEAFTFLHVSDWSHNKNPEGIIRAFGRLQQVHPEVRLRLVGGKGSRFEEVRSLTDGSGGYIECVGEVSYAEVAHGMQRADCLLLFSWMENSPCVIGEALCAGLQVIATEVGGVSELVDLSCSQLVGAGDEEALYHAMESAIGRRDRCDRKDISSRARERFSYPVVGSRIFKNYEEVAGGRD